MWFAGDYQFQHRLGRGAFGEVWRAAHQPSGRAVAVKFFLDTPHGLGSGWLREAQQIARLDHPGIVRILDLGRLAPPAMGTEGEVEPGTPFVGMELAEGGSLVQLVARIGRWLHWWEVRDVLVAVLDALAHAHGHGVLHRDIKADNVLLAAGRTLRERVRLADFGIALDVAEAETELRRVGTLGFAAPEQAAGDVASFGPWTDLHAVGRLAWQLVASDRSFQASVHGWPAAPPLEELHVEVPEALPAWIARLLQPDPDDRFRTAADALAALRSLDAPGARAPVAAADPAKTQDLHEPPPAAPHALVAAPVPPSWRSASRGADEAAPAEAQLRLFQWRRDRLHGREAERDALWAALVEVAATGRLGRARLVGPARSGRTALLRWFERAVRESGAAVWVGWRALVGVDPHAVMGRALRGALFPAAQEEVAVDRIGRRLARLGFRDPVERTATARLLAGPGPDDTPLPGAQQRGLAARLLGVLAGERPVVVAVDDADAIPEVAGLVRHLAGAATGPILVLTSAIAADAADPEAAVVPVAPLPAGSLVDLIRSTLPLDGDLTELLRARAGHNPAWVMDALEFWVREGWLLPGPLGFRVPADRRDALPIGVEELWRVRLDRALAEVGDPGLRALGILAALGTEADEGTWAASCAEAGVDVAAVDLAGLQRHGVVQPRPGGWAFPEPVVHRAVQARVAGSAGELHAACARALTRGGASARVLSRHLVQARDPRAVEVLLAAATEAQRQNDVPGAEELLEIREELLRQAGVPSTDVRWGEGRLVRLTLLHERGRLDDAQKLAERLGREARRHGWTRLLPRVRRLEGVAERLAGAYDRAEDALRDAVAYAEVSGDRWEYARAMLHLGTTLRLLQASDRATMAFAAAREAFDGLGDDHGVADTDSEHANLLIETDPSRAEALLDGAVLRYEAVGRPSGVAFCLNSLAELQRRSGRFEAAEGSLRRAQELFEAIGHRGRYYAEVNRVLVRFDAGAAAEALVAADAALVRLGRGGPPALRPYLDLVRVNTLHPVRDAPAWQEAVDRAVRDLDDPDRVDRDLARLAAVGAARAEGLGVAAGPLWRLAATLYRRLGDEAAARSCEGGQSPQ